MFKTKHFYQGLLAKTGPLCSLFLLNLLNGAAAPNGSPTSLNSGTTLSTVESLPIATAPVDLTTVVAEAVQVAEAIPIIVPAVPETAVALAATAPGVDASNPVQATSTRARFETNLPLDDTQSVYSTQTLELHNKDEDEFTNSEYKEPLNALRWCIDGTSNQELLANWIPTTIPKQPDTKGLPIVEHVKHILFNIPGALQQNDSREYLRDQVNQFLIAAWSSEPLSHLGKAIPFTGFNDENHFWCVVLKKNVKYPNRRQQLILVPMEAGRGVNPLVFETYRMDRRVSHITLPCHPKVALARVVKILLTDPSKSAIIKNQYFTCNPQGELLILKGGIDTPELAGLFSHGDDLIRITDEGKFNEADLKKARVGERELDLDGYRSTIQKQIVNRDPGADDEAQNFFILRGREMFVRNVNLPDDKILCNNILPTGATGYIDPAVAFVGKIKDNLGDEMPWFTLFELSSPGLYQVKTYHKSPVKFLGQNKDLTEVQTSLSLMHGTAERLADEMPKKSVRLDQPVSP